jgi:hypothetical protein
LAQKLRLKISFLQAFFFFFLNLSYYCTSQYSSASPRREPPPTVVKAHLHHGFISYVIQINSFNLTLFNTISFNVDVVSTGNSFSISKFISSYGLSFVWICYFPNTRESTDPLNPSPALSATRPIRFFGWLIFKPNPNRIQRRKKKNSYIYIYKKTLNSCLFHIKR